MGEKLSLTADEIDRVRTSFDQVWAISTRMAELFYSRLSADAGALPPLFQPEPEDQKQKFMLTLAVIVASLDDRADMEALSERLMQAHAECGVRAEETSVLRDALFWSLEQGLGEAWTASVAAAWNKAYRRLLDRMIVTADG
jgi:hemoglobin-like flavoprotein